MTLDIQGTWCFSLSSVDVLMCLCWWLCWCWSWHSDAERWCVEVLCCWVLMCWGVGALMRWQAGSCDEIILWLFSVSKVLITAVHLRAFWWTSHPNHKVMIVIWTWCIFFLQILNLTHKSYRKKVLTILRFNENSTQIYHNRHFHHFVWTPFASIASVCFNNSYSQTWFWAFRPNGVFGFFSVERFFRKTRAQLTRADQGFLAISKVLWKISPEQTVIQFFRCSSFE
jgi:hypothetical protein